MIAVNWSSVSIAPKPGMRPLPCDCGAYPTPLSLPAKTNSCIAAASGNLDSVPPPVRFHPKAP